MRSRRRRILRRLSILLITPFEAAIAFAAMFAAGVYLIDPTPIGQSALGQVARELLPIWEVLYAAGGLMILVGLIGRSLRLEVAGLSLLVAAIVIQALAIIDFAGTQGIVSAATFAALAGACVGRGWVLVNLWRQVRRAPRRGR